jgi:hypothetical protein
MIVVYNSTYEYRGKKCDIRIDIGEYEEARRVTCSSRRYNMRSISRYALKKPLWRRLLRLSWEPVSREHQIEDTKKVLHEKIDNRIRIEEKYAN